MDDVTPPTPADLIHAEERMRSIVDHVLDGIITIDERGRIASFNPAAEKLFGYTHEEVHGHNVKMLMPEPYHSEHDGYIDNYVHTGIPKIIGIGREVVGRRKDGSTFAMELAVSEFRVGARRYFTGIVRDVTERKQLEQQLRQRLDELADADRQKNEFLAMLAHELRNPLAPLRNALHLMATPGVDAETAQRLRGMMERQLHQLVRLVDDLLDVARIIGGKIELRKEPTDLGAAVMRAVETAQPIIEMQGHDLSITIPERPVVVAGDVIRLAQVIANLITNAAKYTEPGGRIAVRLERRGDAAVVDVLDSGAGITPEMQAKVFDLFVQGDRSLARSQGGLGVGLTLVKRLVDMHDGRVSVQSDGPGHGSVFSIYLPILDQAAAPAPPPQRRPRAADAVRRRVLIVDDNIDAAESVSLILRAAGYDVHCVYDGPSVVDAAKAYRPDVVVLDIGLPGKDGYEVARQLRTETEFRDTPIVAVTGYGQDADRRRSHAAGINLHLTKPVDPVVLQNFVAGRRGRDDRSHA